MEPQLTKTGLKGESVGLPCLITDGQQQKDNFVLEWFKDSTQVFSIFSGSDKGHPAEILKGRVRHGGNNTLWIDEIQPTDRGTYWCSISPFNKPVNKVVGGAVQLVVETKPIITKFPQSPIYIVPGQTLEIQCDADGYPFPNVYWEKDRKKVKPGGRVFITPKSLVITGLEATDAGKYGCQVQSNRGSDRKDVKVILHSEPRFENPPLNRTALDGYQLLWQCRAKAEPNNITYSWFYGDKKIIYANSLGLRSKIQTTGDLLITKVRKEDTGWYTCSVNSGNFEKSVSAYLDVQYPPQILPSTSGIQRLPLGLPGSLLCEVDANPEIAHITWTHRGMVLIFPTSVGGEENPPRYISSNGAKLNFHKVAQTDSGPYTCQAFNTHGNSQVFEIHAIVQDPPVYLEVPQREYHRREGQSVTLKCSASGSPAPVVRWIRKDKGFDSAGRVSQVGQATLSIEQLRKEDHGKYACVVENEVATLSKETMLIITDTSPQHPENVTVISAAFQATVTFVPGYNGGYEQTFELKYKERGSSEWLDQPIAKHQTYVTVSRLKPATYYHFRIIPRSSKGEGTPSEEILAQTAEPNYAEDSLPMDLDGSTYIPVTDRSVGPKPDPPTNLHIQAEKEHLVLSWKSPDQRKVKIPYYTVEYKENNDKRKKQRETPQTIVRSEEFKQLGQHVIGHTTMKVSTKSLFSPGSTYDFQVKSHSLSSVSDPSNVVTFAMPGVSPQMALIAGIVGGMIFLMLCLVLVGIGIKCSKRNKKPVKNGTCNGHHTKGIENGNGRYQHNHMLDEFGSPYPPVKATASRPDCCLSWNARVSRLKQLCQRGKPQLPGCQSTGWYFRRDLSTTKQVNQPVNEPVFDSISKRGESVEAVWNGQIQSNHIGGGTISTSISNRTSQALYSTLCYTRDKLMATLALIRTWRTVRSEICNQNIELSENHISTISSSGTISRGIGGISNDSKDRDISNHTRYSADNKSTEVTSVDKMFQAHNYLIQCKPFVHTKTTYVI